MTARIVLHFHPGWAFGEGTVLDSIAASGVYRSQWETGTSNGGLTAFPGGDRWRWESRLFQGRYDEADAAGRPVYGAWNRRDDPYGASSRFGSAYLRLRPEVNDRATFCWPDSVFDPQAVGGPERLEELCRLADAFSTTETSLAMCALQRGAGPTQRSVDTARRPASVLETRLDQAEPPATEHRR